MEIVSYSSPKYRAVYANHLGASLDAMWFNGTHVDIAERGSWLLNTQAKPSVILDELCKHDSVLYIDSDAEILRPEVLDIDYIVPRNCIGAYYPLPHGQWYGNGSSVVEPLTGTLFFRKQARELLYMWRDEMTNTDLTDGQAFARVLPAYEAQMFKLPIEWCYIAEMPANLGLGGIPCDKPIIVHKQASRRLR